LAARSDATYPRIIHPESPSKRISVWLVRGAGTSLPSGSVSTVVVQMSLVEGFGLTVAEIGIRLEDPTDLDA
jgi:hypothetical protein